MSGRIPIFGDEIPAFTAMNVRPAAVAGAFYPREAASLASQVGGYLGAARADSRSLRPKAIIAPHAGYIYSGPIAASVYALLGDCRGTVRRVVLAGPAHRVYVTGAAVPSVSAFDSPLGPVPIDREEIGRASCRERV